MIEEEEEKNLFFSVDSETLETENKSAGIGEKIFYLTV